MSMFTEPELRNDRGVQHWMDHRCKRRLDKHPSEIPKPLPCTTIYTLSWEESAEALRVSDNYHTHKPGGSAR